MKLEELRIKKHWSKAELHRKSGVSLPIISMIEKGYKKYNKLTIQKLADALGVDVKEIENE